jgi:hypothetical protein
MLMLLRGSQTDETEKDRSVEGSGSISHSGEYKGERMK